MTARRGAQVAGPGAPAPSARARKPETPEVVAPAPSAKRRKMLDSLEPPNPWPFPIWNGRPVPRPKRQVARKVPPDFWEESPF